MKTVLSVIEAFCKANLSELRKNIVRTTSKDNKDTLRIPLLNVGSGIGNYQQYETVETFTANDKEEYLIQIRMLSRVVKKSDVTQSAKSKAETFEL